MYLSRVNEGLDVIVTRLRETSAIEEDAKKWQAYQAEQEKIRMAEEERKEKIRKAEEKVARRNEICKRLEAEWKAAMDRLMEAEKELEALKDEKEVA